MDLTPNRLIESALDNLKRRLAAAVPHSGPMTPADCERLPGAIREFMDSLRAKGLRNIRSEDVLSEARADLVSRLAGSLKAGTLIPSELSPEIVKWLAGTPLAVPVANMIRPTGRPQKTGGSMAIPAIGPIAILAKPPGNTLDGNGPVSILSKPPGDQMGNNGSIGIIAHPPGDNGPISILSKPPGDKAGNNGPIGIIAHPPGDNGPIYILSRPPADSGPIYILAKPPSGGSRSESKKGRIRLQWFLPVGLSVVIILFLLGMLAGSINLGNGQTPTETIAFPAGVSGKTSTTTPSGTSAPSLTITPTVAALSSPTPTGTLTATLSWTETQSPTMTPASFFQTIAEPNHIYYRGAGCGEKQARFQVKVADPAQVAGVWLLVRLKNKEGGDVTGWSGSLVMTAEGAGWYSYTLPSEEITDFSKFRDAWVQYQFVAYDANYQRISTSEVFWDVELSACGR